MRLIDRDRLYETLYEIRMDEIAKYGRNDTKHCCSLSTALYEIYNAPTIDPVKHGRWIFSPDHSEGICTACNSKIYGRPYQNTYVIVPHKYCPNCGAKMDEVTKDE